MSSKPGFRVASVTDSMAYSPEKGTHRVKNVNLEMFDGTHTYVTLPHDQYTAENVAKMAQEAAEEHARVMGLKGPPVG